MFVQTPNTLFVLFSEHTKLHEYSVTQTSTIIRFSLCLHFAHRFEPFCQKILKYLSKAPIHKPAAKSQSYLFHCLLFCSNSPFFFRRHEIQPLIRVMQPFCADVGEGDMFLRADSVLWSGFCGAVVLEEKRRRGTGGVINCFLLLKTDE